MENNQNPFINQTPFQPSPQPPFESPIPPTPAAPKKSNLPLVLIILAAVLVIAALAYFFFIRPQDSSRESSELSQTDTTEPEDASNNAEEVDSSKEAKFLNDYDLPEDMSFEELEKYVESHNLGTTDSSNDEDIPDNYGIDERRLNRAYVSITYDESLLEKYTSDSSSLIYNTLSDYFSYAYPNYTSLTLTAGSDDSSLELISNTEKKYTVSLTASSSSDLLEVSNLTILSDSGQSLLSYNNRFMSNSTSESGFNDADFENIFEEETNEE